MNLIKHKKTRSCTTLRDTNNFTITYLNKIFIVKLPVASKALLNARKFILVLDNSISSRIQYSVCVTYKAVTTIYSINLLKYINKLYLHVNLFSISFNILIVVPIFFHNLD